MAENSHLWHFVVNNINQCLGLVPKPDCASESPKGIFMDTNLGGLSLLTDHNLPGIGLRIP